MRLKEGLLLYHGTTKEFGEFDIKRARDYKDFGKGFYLTSVFEQAVKWAQKRYSKSAYVYCYRVGKIEPDQYKILELLEYNKQWLDFIVKNRMNGGTSEYDIVYDKMADNQYENLSEYIAKYYNNEMEASEVLDLIKFKNICRDQYCFCTEKAIHLLHREKAIMMFKDEKEKWSIETEGLHG